MVEDLDHARSTKVYAHEQRASCSPRHVSVQAPRQGSHEDAHELTAGGTEDAQEESEPQATSSKGNRDEASRQHGLGSRALQGNPCRQRRSNTRRSRQDDRILVGTKSTVKSHMKSSTRKRVGRSPIGKKCNTSKPWACTRKYRTRMHSKQPDSGRKASKWVDVTKADGRHRSWWPRRSTTVSNKQCTRRRFR